MTEYIEREAAISKLRLVEVREASINFAASMLSELKRIPAADVQPVRHGRWVGEYDGYADGYPVYDMWSCSECGWDCDGADEEPTWNYCPNCGADMREANNETP